MESVRARRAGRGAPCHAAHRVVLLARPAAGWRRRLRPRHRGSRRRQVGHLAPSRRATLGATWTSRSACAAGPRPISPTSIARWATCSASSSVPHNRWAGAKVAARALADPHRCLAARPVLIVDEAQEMLSTVLSELRLLCSTRLDSHILLTVVLAGDGRLLERLRSDEFPPLASRMRVRLGDRASHSGRAPGVSQAGTATRPAP